MRDHTTDGLLESIAWRGSLAFEEHALSRGRALTIADDEMLSTVCPMILSLRSRYFRAFVDVTLTDATRYPIPAAAAGRALQNVAAVDSSGRESALTSVDHDLEMDGSGWEAWANQMLGGGDGYYVDADDIVLYPNSHPGKTLRIFFYQMPNRLVESSAAGRVTGVDVGTGVVSLAALPLSWAIGTSLCGVAGSPGFRLRFAARAVTAVGALSVTLGDVTGIAVGDWLALEGDSPIPQIPVEAHPVLAQAVVVKYRESIRDPGLSDSQAKLKELRDSFVTTYTPRVEQAPKTISAGRGLRRWM